VADLETVRRFSGWWVRCTLPLCGHHRHGEPPADLQAVRIGLDGWQRADRGPAPDGPTAWEWALAPTVDEPGRTWWGLVRRRRNAT